MQKPNDLQVLNDIRVLIGNQHQKQFFHGQVHIPDVLSLNVCALFSYSPISVSVTLRYKYKGMGIVVLTRFYKFREVGHVFFKFQTSDRDEVSGN